MSNLVILDNKIINLDRVTYMEEYETGNKEIWTEVHLSSNGIVRVHLTIKEIEKLV